MSFETFENCLKKIPASVDVYFAGMSEAWINPECTKMVLHSHKKGHNISVFTTLVGMRLEDFEAVKNLPFKEFNIHLPSNEGLEKISTSGQYFQVLEKFSRSPMQILYHCHGSSLPEKIQDILKEKNISYWDAGPTTRAGNVQIANLPMPKKKKGLIKCTRNLSGNVLMPNGDVILCCMDYKMQHILGNLLYSSYKSLFSGPEFKKILMSQKTENSETLCRYCEFAADCDFKAKFLNLWPLALKKIREVKNMKELGLLFKKGASKFFSQ